MQHPPDVAPVDHETEEYAHDVSHHVRKYLMVGALLLIFTGLTVFLSYVDFGSRKLNMAIGMLVATFKAGMVGAIFMHLAAETVLSKEALGADCCLWDVTAYREEVLGIWPIERNSPLLALGTKGLLRVELYTQTATVLPPALYGTIVPNAIWRVLWALNSLKDVREEVLIEGFYDTLRPANDEIVEQLYTLPDPARLLAERWGMKQLLLGLQGFQLHYAHLLTPTCTVRSFTDGTSSSQELSDFLPTVAGAQVDFSLVPEQSPADIFAKLQRHLHEKGFADIQVRQVKATPPIQTTFTTSFTQLIYQATSEANGHEPILLPIAPSSTPDALAQSLPPIVITAQCGPQDEEQRKDENIAVQYLAKAIKQMVLIFFLLGSKC